MIIEFFFYICFHTCPSFSFCAMILEFKLKATKLISPVSSIKSQVDISPTPFAFSYVLLGCLQLTVA